MTFSCSDFTDQMLNLMGEHGFVRADDLPQDNPERQYEVASGAIEMLATLKQAAVALAKLLKEKGLSEGEVGAQVEAVLAAADGIAPRYLVSEGYGHIFSGKTETLTRWVMDLDTGEFVAAQMQRAGWKTLSGEDAADLMEDVRDANGVREDPDAYGAETANELPEWCA